MTMTREHWLIPETSFASYQDFLARTGESAALKARTVAAEAVLEEIERSGLLGRGGAGFPAGMKWRNVRSHPCPIRYVVCNAAEGEPGTFKDRWLLRKNPFSVLEGMLVAAYVVGARSLYIAIQASFTKELAHLHEAIGEMSEAGVFEGYEIHVVEGPDHYLFGEEKALLEVISGNDPLPREAHYPPYELGLFATATSPNPALVNNVETFAHVPGIVRAGSASFRRLGTQDTPGTLIFTVTGDVRIPGVYELEAGISLRELFNDVAGGPKDGRSFKAALSGFSSRVIPAHEFDTPADFGSLKRIGAGLGSAGFMVLDDRASMPHVAQAVARFLYVESCNQCSACKLGLREASLALDQLFEPGVATRDAISRARHGARSAPQANRCYLPVQGSILIPSLLECYAAEFEERVRAPIEATERMLVPKIEDFDERTSTFTFDTRLASKNPDWTYAETTPSTDTDRPRLDPDAKSRVPAHPSL